MSGETATSLRPAGCARQKACHQERYSHKTEWKWRVDAADTLVRVSGIGIHLVALLAESHERSAGVVEFGRSAVDPPVPPLPVQVIDVISRSHEPRVTLRLGVEQRETQLLRRLPAHPVAENHHVVVKRHLIVRQVIVLREFANHRFEFPRVAAGAGLLVQQFQRDRPFVLLPAVFARMERKRLSR